MNNPVPNLFPRIQSERRICLIGEAPGKDEVAAGQPFVGMSGRFLAALLSRAGISREACFLGNVSQYRPPDNNISLFSWTGLEIQHGLETLREDIEKFNPNVVVLLGNVPLKAAKDPTRAHPLKPNSFAFKNSQWRGSLFLGHDDGPFRGRKCMATYHPAYCLRDYECTPLLQFDLKKAARQATYPDLKLPERKLVAAPPFEYLCGLLAGVNEARSPVAIDIEGYIDSMSCISFAASPGFGFIVPLVWKGGKPVWQPHEECFIWRKLAQVLENPLVPKVLQNSLYDRFVLHYSYGIRVQGVVDDTMLKHWELYSELEKSLGVQASLYTDEPYYKQDRKSDDDRTFFEYCIKDSAVTLEINQKLEGMLTGTSKSHYRMNVAMLNPLLYMELRGIRYDCELARTRQATLLHRRYEVQALINSMSGYGFGAFNHSAILLRARELYGFKRATISSFDELLQNCKKDGIPAVLRLCELLRTPSPDLATLGELEDLCQLSLNIDSSKQFIPFLYERLGLPTQYTEKRNEEPRPTADYEALLKLSRHIIREHGNADPRLTFVQKAIELRALSTRAQMLSIHADKDGRIRCGYNIVGSNTGRITCYESPTGSGYNLQTIPNYTSTPEAPGGVLGDRDLFLSDLDYWFFQCDLSGADGWTVAAYSAMLGDPTLLDDYRFGLKPARNLAIKILGFEAKWEDRESLREAGKRVKKDDWAYFAAKRVQHGGSYLEGGLTISRNILKDSEGKLYLTPKECDNIKEFFFQRYPGIRKWHGWVASRLKERPVLTAASGQVRQFFGRPDDILTKAVAFEPQANTTYATNTAMYRLWTDADNRLPNGKLRIEPLHQVHDALCGQFRKEDTAWAATKIKSYFDNPMKIAGQTITIPYEGGYGPSWGNLEVGKL